MATEKEFYHQKSLDRTAYGACGLVAGALVFCLIIGVALLWNAGGYVKKHATFAIPGIPGLPTFNPNTNLVNDVSNQIKDKASTTLSDQKQAAEEAAQKAVEKQVQQQTDNLKDAAGAALQKNLNL